MSGEKAILKRDAQVRHQQQFVWQILTPVLITLLIVLAILILLISSAGTAASTNEKWADISTIFMLLPTLLFGLLTLAVILLFAWLIDKLRKTIPPYTSRVSHVAEKASQITDRVTDKGLSPFIYIRSYISGAQRLFSLIIHGANNREE